MKRILFAFMGVLGLLMAFSCTGNPNKVCTLHVKETQIPVIIGKTDNVLFHLEVDAKKEVEVQSVDIQFGKSLDTLFLKSVSLVRTGAGTQPDSLLCRVPVTSQKVRLTCASTLPQGKSTLKIVVAVDAQADVYSTFTASLSQVRVNKSNVNAVVTSPKDIVHRLAIALRHANDQGVSVYRIPGLTTTNQGTLLAVYDIRYNGVKDLQEHIDIGLSRSTDGGRTWGPMQIVMTREGYGGLPLNQNGTGDPCILYDTQKKTAWIAAWWTHGMPDAVAWLTSGPGMSPQKTGQLLVVKSTDDGCTWSEPVNLTSMVKKPSWRVLLQGPGRGITTSDGVLVFPIQYKDSTGTPMAGIMYSKDHGARWSLSAPARSNTTESQVVELPDGSLMLNMRDNRGGSRAVSTTRNWGRTWEEHPTSRKALPEPVCMASLLSVKAAENQTGQDLLFFSNPNTDHAPRCRTTLKMSLDNGLTWLPKHQILLDEGENWGYSCLTLVDANHIGILYESSQAHITFQVIPIAAFF